MALTVYEYDKIIVSRKRNIEDRIISFEDYDKMKVFDTKYPGIFLFGYRSVQVKQWIGVIDFGDFVLEILPKISKTNKSINISIVLEMLSVSYDVPYKKSVLGKVQFENKGLIDIMIETYLYHNEIYITSGKIYSYNQKQKNINSIKGSLDFSKHISKNFLCPSRFFCKYSNFTDDNEINRVIKHVLKVMLKVSKNNNTKRKIKEHLFAFSGIYDIFNVESAVKNIKLNRLQGNVTFLLELSKLFLKGCFPSLTIGNYCVNSLLFDMNEIFEKYILAQLKKIYVDNLVYHDSTNYLLKNNSGEKIQLKPDFLLNIENKKIVVDTKWKKLQKVPLESDLYQMNAYVTTITNVQSCVILYPQSMAINKSLKYIFNSNKVDLYVKEIDLSIIIEGEKRFQEYLKNLFLI